MDVQRLRIYERAVLVLMMVGPAIAIFGTALSASTSGDLHAKFTVVATLGVLLTAASIAGSYPIIEFRTVLRKDARGAVYAQQRYLGQLKASAILLNFLWLLGLVGLVVALLARANVIEGEAPGALAARLAALGVIALLANLTHVHFLSLRIPLPRDRGYPTTPFLLISLAVTALFALFAIGLSERGTTLGGLNFDPSDAPLFLLAAVVFASIDLVVARPVPNLLSLFREGRGPPGARDYISKTKSILLPAVTAFALLFVILLLLLFVGVGPGGIQGPIQVSVFVFIGIGIILSIVFSIRLARSEDVYELYRIKQARDTRVGNLILYISGAAAAVMGLIGLYLLRGGSIGPITPVRWVDVVSIGLLIAFGPYGFYIQRRLKRVRRLEERFPDFLRDVAASHRGGLTLTASVQIAAKGEYGELTPEIRKMADQLTWNVPFNEALTQLMNRVQTPLIERAITLIIEASRTGGSTTDVLLAAARDAREIKNLENERRQTMGLYTVIIYITFFVFLVVAAVLYGQLVPEILKAAEAASAAGASGVGALQLNVPAKGEYRAFYFLAALVQAVGNGLVGGLFQSGKVLVGLRHAFLMVLITYVTFTFVFP